MFIANQVVIAMRIADRIVVVLPNRRCGVTRRSHSRSLLHWIGLGCHVGHAQHAMLPWPKPRHQRRPRGGAAWRAGVRVLKSNAFLRDAIEMWSMNRFVAISAHAVHAQLV